jgi:subtilase family serine protease
MEREKVMRYKTFLSMGVILLFSSILALAALDLTFTTSISQTPDPATAGSAVTFTVSFKTIGGPADNLKITGGVDGSGILERTYAHINAGLQRTDTFTWTATAGSHTVWFELDPMHTCGDSNYSNNRVEKAITVGGSNSGNSNADRALTVKSFAAKPDLVPVVTYSPAHFTAGDTVVFSIQVNNNGVAASTDNVMRLRKAGDALVYTQIPVIAAGGHWDYTYSWTAECDATHPIILELDPYNACKESNENNNIWFHTLACFENVKVLHH